MISLFVRIERLGDYKRTENFKVDEKTIIEKLKKIIRKRFNENDEFNNAVLEKYGKSFKDMKIKLTGNVFLNKKENRILTVEETVGKNGTLANLFEKTGKASLMRMYLVK